MLNSLLESISTINERSLVFLGILFLVNVLGEAAVPFPFFMQGVLVLIGYNLGQSHFAFGMRLLAFAVTGSLTGAMILYALSKVAGPPLLRRIRNLLHIKPEKVQRMESRLRDSNALAIAFGRVIPGLLVPTTLVAGVLRIPWYRFLLGVLLSEVIWVLPFLTLGIIAELVSFDMTFLFAHLSRVIGLLAIGLLLMILLRFLWRRYLATRAG